MESELDSLKKWQALTTEEKTALGKRLISRYEKETDPESLGRFAHTLAESGEIWNWPTDILPTVDVPSTGGPGSLTTLLCPYLLAASGLYVPKLSVPGSTAGAIDVLGLLQGFQTGLSRDQMLNSLRASRIAHSMNTDNVAPADGFLFKLRTQLDKKSVPSLAISSLLCKKIAAGCSTAVFDVRCHKHGNLGNTFQTCESNARLMISAAQSIGISIACAITDHSEVRFPYLGRSESLIHLIEIMRPGDGLTKNAALQNHIDCCIKIAAHASAITQNDPSSAGKIEDEMRSLLQNGTVWNTFRNHLLAQGASSDSLEKFTALYAKSAFRNVASSADGFIVEIDVRKIAANLRSINDRFGGLSDTVGIELTATHRQRVAAGQVIAILRASAIVPEADVEDLVVTLKESIIYSKTPPSTTVDELFAIVA